MQWRAVVLGAAAARRSLCLSGLQSIMTRIGSAARHLGAILTRVAHADEYHDLKVVVDKPGLTARTSSGNYNQPQAETVPTQ